MENSISLTESLFYSMKKKKVLTGTFIQVSTKTITWSIVCNGKGNFSIWTIWNSELWSQPSKLIYREKKWLSKLGRLFIVLLAWKTKKCLLHWWCVGGAWGCTCTPWAYQCTPCKKVLAVAPVGGHRSPCPPCHWHCRRCQQCQQVVADCWLALSAPSPTLL